MIKFVKFMVDGVQGVTVIVQVVERKRHDMRTLEICLAILLILVIAVFCVWIFADLEPSHEPSHLLSPSSIIEQYYMLRVCAVCKDIIGPAETDSIETHGEKTHTYCHKCIPGMYAEAGLKAKPELVERERKAYEATRYNLKNGLYGARIMELLKGV